VESIIFSEMMRNDQFFVKVVPHLKKEYFDLAEDRAIFNVIGAFYSKYVKRPTFAAVATIVDRKRDMNEELFSNIMDRLEEIKSYDEDNDLEWLVDETEEFCKRKAFENAIISAADILESGGNRYAAKEMVDEALKVNFDRHLGIDFFDSQHIKNRFELYNRKNRKFKTHLDKLNYLTGGGFEEKALHVFLGDTHSGKTMTLSSLAAGFVRNGYDVLYITLEMAEEKIARLIDANFIDIKINDVADEDPESFHDRLVQAGKECPGRLFVREYPTTTAGVSTFRSLLDDYKYKMEFEPQIVIVDYINIMKCDRYSEGNSYTLVKGIAEELRGLAVEKKYCIVSATQTNREGGQSSDISFRDTAESYGLPQTVDLLVGMMTSETLRERNLLVWKSMKNRLAGVLDYKFPVKTQFAYAKILDCDPEHENIITNDQKNVLAEKKERQKEKLRKLAGKVNNKDVIKSQSDNDLFN
jgi:replicative DNA helicase